MASTDFIKCPSCAGLPTYSDATDGEAGRTGGSMKWSLCAGLPTYSEATVEGERVGQAVGWNASGVSSQGMTL